MRINAEPGKSVSVIDTDSDTSLTEEDRTESKSSESKTSSDTEETSPDTVDNMTKEKTLSNIKTDYCLTENNILDSYEPIVMNEIQMSIFCLVKYSYARSVKYYWQMY